MTSAKGLVQFALRPEEIGQVVHARQGVWVLGTQRPLLGLQRPAVQRQRLIQQEGKYKIRTKMIASK